MANEMRSKDEIVEAVGIVILEGKQIDIEMYILEVLLDIRELLQQLQPPIIIADTEISTHADKGLHHQNHQHS